MLSEEFLMCADDGVRTNVFGGKNISAIQIYPCSPVQDIKQREGGKNRLGSDALEYNNKFI